jgi:hypothetical protein
MAHLFLDVSQGLTPLEQERREAVPEVMEANSSQPRVGQEPIEELSEVALIDLCPAARLCAA